MRIAAISVHQPWASWIASGEKTIETRSRRIRYRGPLVICASQRPKVGDLPTGVALCVVELVDCRPMREEDVPLAIGSGATFSQKLRVSVAEWAWCFESVRRFDEPFPVKGRQGLFYLENWKMPFWIPVKTEEKP